MLIASHARHTCATVVTNNEGEFRRVPGLSVESWLKPCGGGRIWREFRRRR